MDKEQFDEWFDRAFDESVKQHDFVPDPSPSWEQVQLKLAKRKRIRSRLKLLPYIAASFMLGAFLFGTPTVSNAFNPFFKAVVSIKDDMVQIIFGERESKTKPKTAPPPSFRNVEGLQDPSPTVGLYYETGNETSKTDSFATWEEARTKFAFKLPHTLYIPEDYRLDEASAFYSGISRMYRSATLVYSLNGEKQYTVYMRKVSPHELISSGGNEVTVKQVNIKNTPAYLIVSNDGYASLEFVHNAVYFMIAGPLPEDELVQIAISAL